MVEGSGRLPEPLRSCLDGCDVARADSPAQALEALRDDSFEALLADPRDPALRDAFADLARRGRTLDALPDGVAVVDAGLRVIWANPAFERCSGGPAGGRAVGEALGDPQALGPNSPPFAAALAGRPAVTRLHSRDNRHFEIRAAIDDSRWSGPINEVAPTPVRNAELTAALASALHRPALLHVPAFALRLVLGEISEELLGSRRVVPERALALGYRFQVPTLDRALEAELR